MLALAACGAPDPFPDPVPAPADYSWDLPAGDTTSDGVDGEIYQALLRSCDDGETTLTQRWQASSGPREVLLFEAGVLACRGDIAGARALYDRAREEFGWTGLGPVQVSARCDLYKSVASVVEKAPRDRFPCPDGTAAAFQPGANGEIDNPLTPVDESALSDVGAPPPTDASARPVTDPAIPRPGGGGVVRSRVDGGGAVGGGAVSGGVVSGAARGGGGRSTDGSESTGATRNGTTRGSTPPSIRGPVGPPIGTVPSPGIVGPPPPPEPQPVPVPVPVPVDMDPAATDPPTNMNPAATKPPSNMDPAATEPPTNMNPATSKDNP
ncbi:hypothetical protein [Pseudonocardia charpentierae]|uniref:Tetratricopeptide repeat-containing protein n=1 Tax=Pseudonocardia charpentierae TaxID=3075545 RepID=A0ABU2NB86_9PSEU|nr:hypothetical protein [Pseudonocardia sp. DSM 45834]MDT0351217.1 hypothetical protein [Pseudonocardia sp. DSM 45834]